MGETQTSVTWQSFSFQHKCTVHIFKLLILHLTLNMSLDTLIFHSKTPTQLFFTPHLCWKHWGMVNGGFYVTHLRSKDLTGIKEAFTRQLAPHWDKTTYRIFAFLEAQENCSLEARLVIEALIVCFNLPAAVWKGQKGSKIVINIREQICHFQVFSQIHLLKVLSTEASKAGTCLIVHILKKRFSRHFQAVCPS